MLYFVTPNSQPLAQLLDELGQVTETLHVSLFLIYKLEVAFSPQMDQVR